MLAQLSAAGVNATFLVLLTSYIARRLGSAALGQWAFAFSFAAFAYVLAEFGLANLTIREISRDQEQGGFYVANVLILRLLTGCLSLLVAITALHVLGYKGVGVTLAIVLAVGNLFLSLGRLGTSVFDGLQRMEVSAFLVVSKNLLTLALSLIVVKLGFGIIGVGTSFLAGYAVFAGLALYVLFARARVRSLKVDLQRIRWLARSSLPFAVTAGMGIAFYKVDVLLLSSMQEDQAVGLYNAAYRLLELAFALPPIFVAALYPVMSSQFLSSHTDLTVTYQRGMKYLMILAVPTAAGMSLYAEPIIGFLYGREFRDSVPALQILSWSIIPFYFNIISGNLLMAINQQAIHSTIPMINLVGNVLLNLYLIPRYSFVGSSIATLVSFIGAGVLHYVYVRKFYGAVSIQNIAWRLMIAVLGVFIASLTLSRLGFFVSGILAVMLYCGLLLITGTFDSFDLSLARRLVDFQVERT